VRTRTRTRTSQRSRFSYTSTFAAAPYAHGWTVLRIPEGLGAPSSLTLLPRKAWSDWLRAVPFSVPDFERFYSATSYGAATSVGQSESHHLGLKMWRRHRRAGRLAWQKSLPTRASNHFAHSDLVVIAVGSLGRSPKSLPARSQVCWLRFPMSSCGICLSASRIVGRNLSCTIFIS